MGKTEGKPVPAPRAPPGGWEVTRGAAGGVLGGALVCDDELVAAPVLVAVVREVAADNDGDLPAPVGETKK